MPPVGTKPNYRKFRRRHRRAGLALGASLAVVVFGALLFARMVPTDLQLSALRSVQKSSVERVESTRLAGAPEAVAKQEARTAQTAAEQRQNTEVGATRPADRPEPAESAAPLVPPTKDLWMSIPALGLYDNYVANSNDPAALDVGAAKTVESGFPWQDNANTYISAHRLGYPGTASYRQFYNLPLLQLGDVIYLGDINGTTYTYEVTGFQEVTPADTWITAPKPGRDMISLQTCIENYGDYWTMGPNWYVRYIVQADRISVAPAA
jgi:sortase A